MYALKYVGILRVSRAGEIEGLDLHEHGASAYPEYSLLSSDGTAINTHKVVDTESAATAGD